MKQIPGTVYVIVKQCRSEIIYAIGYKRIRHAAQHECGFQYGCFSHIVCPYKNIDSLELLDGERVKPSEICNCYFFEVAVHFFGYCCVGQK